LLKETLEKTPTKTDSFAEIFSTHPNIIKRLRALRELSINQTINQYLIQKLSLPTMKGLYFFSCAIIDDGPCPG
jgi:hypothetical protein